MRETPQGPCPRDDVRPVARPVRRTPAPRPRRHPPGTPGPSDVPGEPAGITARSPPRGFTRVGPTTTRGRPRRPERRPVRRATRSPTTERAGAFGPGISREGWRRAPSTVPRCTRSSGPSRRVPGGTRGPSTHHERALHARGASRPPDQAPTPWAEDHGERPASFGQRARPSLPAVGEFRGSPPRASGDRGHSTPSVAAPRTGSGWPCR